MGIRVASWTSESNPLTFATAPTVYGAAIRAISTNEVTVKLMEYEGVRPELCKHIAMFFSHVAQFEAAQSLESFSTLILKSYYLSESAKRDFGTNHLVIEVDYAPYVAYEAPLI